MPAFVIDSVVVVSAGLYHLAASNSTVPRPTKLRALRNDCYLLNQPSEPPTAHKVLPARHALSRMISLLYYYSVANGSKSASTQALGSSRIDLDVSQANLRMLLLLDLLSFGSHP